MNLFVVHALAKTTSPAFTGTFDADQAVLLEEQRGRYAAHYKGGQYRTGETPKAALENFAKEFGHLLDPTVILIE